MTGTNKLILIRLPSHGTAPVSADRTNGIFGNLWGTGDDEINDRGVSESFHRDPIARLGGRQKLIGLNEMPLLVFGLYAG